MARNLGLLHGQIRTKAPCGLPPLPCLGAGGLALRGKHAAVADSGDDSGAHGPLHGGNGVVDHGAARHLSEDGGDHGAAGGGVGAERGGAGTDPTCRILLSAAFLSITVLQKTALHVIV